MREIAGLFFIFARLGCIAFGGGYTLLPLLQREFVKKRGWVSADEILRYYTIAQITPGVIAVNLATFIGYKRAGSAGGIAATLGFVLPSSLAVVGIALTLKGFSQIAAVRHCFNGVKIAACALVIDTVLNLMRQIPKKEASVPQNAAALLLFALSFFFSAFFAVNPVFIIAAAALAAFLPFFKKADGETG
jgi:chromate transporter